MNTFTSVSGWTSQNEHDPLQNNSRDYYTIIAPHSLLLPLELSSENVTLFKNILNICRRSFEGGFPCSSVGKESACSAGDLDSIPGLGRSLEKEMATHSSILAWKISWTEEPGGLQSMGLQRVRTTERCQNLSADQS